MPADYDQRSYWHGRFASEKAFEWLLTSEEFMSIITPYLDEYGPSAEILNIGSGTSDLQNHLRVRGFEKVTNVDYEPLATTRGRELEEQAFGDVRMRYAVADATRLPEDLPDSNYDLVIDKSTVDAVSCGGEDKLVSMIHSVRECLAENAAWISLSYSSERFELEDLPFHVDVLAKVPTPKNRETDPDVFFWCYRMTPI
ncbi:hypothetical protein K4F52_004580 [Lecanicillium sp. MT-2017a]|nr:hypothetical protein K4F52_004580 [Lecanicillium sp. MT-2017a]